MSAYVGAVVATLVFILVFRAVGLLRRSASALQVASRAMQDMRSDLGDDAKEALMQGHALQLGGMFLSLSAAGVLALAVPLGVVWLLDRAGVLSMAATLEVLMSWPFLVAVTVLFVGVMLAARRPRPGT